MSLFFGYFLSTLEAPLEIIANDDIIATRAAFAFSNDFMNNLVLTLPKLCTYLFFANLTREELHSEIQVAIEDLLSNGRSFTKWESLDYQVVNVPDLFEFVGKCSTQILEVTDELNFTVNTTSALTVEVGHITFNWIRCTPSNSTNSSAVSPSLNEFWKSVLNPFGAVVFLRPSIQEEYAVGNWHIQQQDLFEEYLQLYLDQSMSQLEARSSALSRSFDEATGFVGCTKNVPGGAWFWFTVMTTIGYGNTSPKTEGGQAMVFTLGFFSILFFAVVLAQSGTIITAIFDDWVERVHLSCLTIPSIAMLFWGCLYYGWMLIIAAYTQNWMIFRLEKEFRFGTAYWFSYMSTTTVGLGDYYLDHSVLLPVDLVVFSLLFLFGFALLSNFLVKLRDFVVEIVGLEGITLAEALRNSNAPCCPLLPKRFKTFSRRRFVEEEESSSVGRAYSGDDGQVTSSADSCSRPVFTGVSQDDSVKGNSRTLPPDVVYQRGTERVVTVDGKVDEESLSKQKSIQAANGWSGLVSSVPVERMSLGQG